MLQSVYFSWIFVTDNFYRIQNLASILSNFDYLVNLTKFRESQKQFRTNLKKKLHQNWDRYTSHLFFFSPARIALHNYNSKRLKKRRTLLNLADASLRNTFPRHFPFLNHLYSYLIYYINNKILSIKLNKY